MAETKNTEIGVTIMTIVCLLSFDLYSEAFESTDWDLMSHCGIIFDQDGILTCFMYGQFRALKNFIDQYVFRQECFYCVWHLGNRWAA